MPAALSEFSLIQRYFSRPIARTQSAFVLGGGDDCALLTPPPGQVLATSMDLLLEGQHFFADTDPFSLGHKALAVNLSDLAAMGAEPAGCVLGLGLPKLDEAWLEAFSNGFYGLAERSRCPLLGGDTTRSCGGIMLSVTVFGWVPEAAAQAGCLQRAHAQIGDDIWVSGHLGAAATAVSLLYKARAQAGAQGASADAAEACVQTGVDADSDKAPARVSADADSDQARVQASAGVTGARASSYTDSLSAEDQVLLTATEGALLLPEPRLDLGRALMQQGLANACIDVSDGFTQDLGHILEESEVGAALESAQIPVHPALAVLGREARLKAACTGGEDYELCFTAPPARRAAIEALSRECDLPLTRMGTITEKPGLTLDGQPFAPLGFDHFRA